jgi:hypothetical protein
MAVDAEAARVVALPDDAVTTLRITGAAPWRLVCRANG